MNYEDKILDRILEFARNSSDVRAVFMTGSRTNSNIILDKYCDYDIAFLVSNPKVYSENKEWINHFGEILIMQHNQLEFGDDIAEIFLMQFVENFRIDLTFFSLKDINDMQHDSLEIVLLDKDDLFDNSKQPTEESYYVKKPTEIEMYDRINNIFWCSTNVGKGLCRKQIPYAKCMFDQVMREDLHKIIDWYIGTNHDWKVNPGMFGKYYYKYLSDEEYEKYLKSFSGKEIADMWKALFEMIDLTNEIGEKLTSSLGYDYEKKEYLNTKKYLMELFNESSS